MIISKTPLRASLFGGGTDFADYYHNSRYGYGSVLSTTLDMHVYITVNRRFDDKIRVVYTGNELVDSVDEVKHNIIREALKITGVTKGVEVVYMADIPMTNLGLGLASSSALAVGVLNALYTFKGEYHSPRELAYQAAHIEIDCLGQQIGIQDQFAVAFGGFRRYFFNADDTVTVIPACADPELVGRLSERLHLFYTGAPRDSRQIFKEQKETIKKSREETLDPLVEAVDEAMDSLKKGDLDRIGTLLDETWQIKKRFASGVSNPDIDDMYEKAIRGGALGGKILGAGGGGFLMTYIPPERLSSVREALKDFREIDFKMDAHGTRIIFAD